MRLFRINQTAPIMMAATIISARTIPMAAPTEELSLPGGEKEHYLSTALSMYVVCSIAVVQMKYLKLQEVHTNTFPVLLHI
jgi:hypothetical protein